MQFFKRNRQRYDLGVLLNEIKNTTDTNRFSTLFIELIAVLRPAPKQSATANMQDLLDALHRDKQLEAALQHMFVYLFNTRDSQSIFTNTGILTGGTFFSELFRQVRHRILPPLPDKRSMSNLLERAFFKKTDYVWVAARRIPGLYVLHREFVEPHIAITVIDRYIFDHVQGPVLLNGNGTFKQAYPVGRGKGVGRRAVYFRHNRLHRWLRFGLLPGKNGAAAAKQQQEQA